MGKSNAQTLKTEVPRAVAVRSKQHGTFRICTIRGADEAWLDAELVREQPAREFAVALIHHQSVSATRDLETLREIDDKTLLRIVRRWCEMETGGESLPRSEIATFEDFREALREELELNRRAVADARQSLSDAISALHIGEAVAFDAATELAELGVRVSFESPAVPSWVKDIVLPDGRDYLSGLLDSIARPAEELQKSLSGLVSYDSAVTPSWLQEMALPDGGNLLSGLMDSVVRPSEEFQKSLSEMVLYKPALTPSWVENMVLPDVKDYLGGLTYSVTGPVEDLQKSLTEMFSRQESQVYEALNRAMLPEMDFGVRADQVFRQALTLQEKLWALPDDGSMLRLGADRVGETIGKILGDNMYAVTGQALASSDLLRGLMPKDIGVTIGLSEALRDQLTLGLDNLTHSYGDMLGEAVRKLDFGFSGEISRLLSADLDMVDTIRRSSSGYFAGAAAVTSVSRYERAQLPIVQAKKASIFAEIEDEMEANLAALDPGLLRAWRGAREALRSGGVDRMRHAASSLRTVLDNLLRLAAPTAAVRAWDTDPTHYVGSSQEPLHRTRINYIFRDTKNPTLLKVINLQAGIYSILMGSSSDVVHSLDDVFEEEELGFLMLQAELLIREVLRHI